MRDDPTRPVRVLFIHGWTSYHGGSPTVLIDILSRIDRRRFEPVVLCTGRGDLTARVEELDVPVITHRLTALRKDGIGRFLVELPWYVRFLRRERVGLVHGNAGCGRRSAVLAAWLCGIPYVQHVHNQVSHARQNFSYRIARRIFTVSDAVGAGLKADPMFSARTVTLYNAIDLSQYMARDTCRDEIAAGARPIVGTVGQLVPRKGMKTAILAMKRVVEVLPAALLVIVGAAPPDEPEYEAECRALVDELQLGGHVHFTGYRRDVPAWMRTFDVFVLPTRSEPFGKVVIEAMAAARPVIASRVGGIPEIISDPSLGTLISPDDPEATAREILGYLSNPDRARRVGELSRRHVSERFTVEAMIASLERSYDSVLGESTAVHPGTQAVGGSQP